MKNKLSIFINPFIIIAVAATLRVIPHMPNFAPITAMALFGGVYLNKRYAFIVPVITMLVSDYLLLYINPFNLQHLTFTHIYSPLSIWYGSSMLAVYGSFLISGLIGLWLKNHKSVRNVIFASLFSSIQFFLITNATVWIGGMYSRSILGLWESYVAGIPFFRGTLTGDFFYTGIFFGGYECVLQLIRSHRLAYSK